MRQGIGRPLVRGQWRVKSNILGHKETIYRWTILSSNPKPLYVFWYLSYWFEETSEKTKKKQKTHTHKKTIKAKKKQKQKQKQNKTKQKQKTKQSKNKTNKQTNR